MADNERTRVADIIAGVSAASLMPGTSGDPLADVIGKANAERIIAALDAQGFVIARKDEGRSSIPGTLL